MRERPVGGVVFDSLFHISERAELTSGRFHPYGSTTQSPNVGRRQSAARLAIRSGILDLKAQPGQGAVMGLGSREAFSFRADNAGHGVIEQLPPSALPICQR